MKYNVCIMGAGTAGMAAAYALRGTTMSNGKQIKVLLVEKRQALGGTASQAWVETWIEGVNPPYLLKLFEQMKIDEGKISNSWLPEKYSSTKGSNLFLDGVELSKLYADDMKSSNVEILLGYSFLSADSDKGKINSIVITNGKESVCIESDFFIDCSADGVLCTYNGVENVDYFVGEDPAARFNEDLLTDNTKADSKNLNEPSLFFKVETRSSIQGKNVKKAEYEKIDPKVEFKYDGYRDRNWVNPMKGFNLSGNALIVRENGHATGAIDSEKAWRELSEQIAPFWSFVHNEIIRRTQSKEPLYGYTQKDLEYFYQGQHAPMLGIRETYRIHCDYMLRQSDLLERISSRNLKRHIACGSHTLDFHVYGNIDDGKVREFNKKIQPSGIPYDCLIPKRFDNVLVACRAYGASHIALSARRINKDMAQLGWAAGNAIRICFEEDLGNTRNVCVSKLQSKEYTNFAESVKHLEQIMK